ncbi:hypothetical protein M0R72_03225 [Candidatus Pacearchaeota archaeon]|jgi:hypothetical protein|nr:hypothetical protein [Candidatus Pacearchaeota archaeon]
MIGAGIGGYFLGQNVMLNSIYPESNEVFSIFGQITSINGDSLVVETNSLQRYIIPGQEQKLTKITINTNEQTKILEQIFSLENSLESTETILSFSDLTVGDSVSVLSSENIKGKSQITATEIIFQSSPINTENSVEEFPE